MARNFTSKDAKLLIKQHKELLEKLLKCIGVLDKYKEKIAELSDKLDINGTFQRIERDELIYGKSDSDDLSLSQLAESIYMYIALSPLVTECMSIKRNNADDINAAIGALSAVTGVFGAFSSQQKKNSANEAYEYLTEKLRDANYTQLIKILDDSISGQEKNLPPDILNDFYTRIPEYHKAFKRCSPSVSRRKLPEIENLIADVLKSGERLSAAEESVQPLKDDIKKAAEKMAAAETLNILRAIPVEELNREKGGIRVKALRDAGYNSMADLYAAQEYQLMSVYGISEDAAYTIKKTAKNFALKAQSEVKIKLSFDNKTKESGKLVSVLYLYRKKSETIARINELKNASGAQIESAAANLKKAGNCKEWLFYSAAEKSEMQESYEFLSGQACDEYIHTANVLISELERTALPKNSDIWADFSENSISYYNILEEIVPGLLGNDDVLYGLPEELAREIQDECFFPDGLNCELRRYQEWGVKYILHQGRVLLGDEMGLGKTVQAIAAMVSLKNVGAAHFIVVCPASVLPNWCKEIASKSKLRVIKVHGPGRAGALKAWRKNGGVAVTTFETTGIFEFEDEFKFDMIVVDEAHFIKNINAARSKNVRALCSFAKRILFMTGTALENNVEEMISLIEVLRPEIAKQISGIAFMSAAPQFREKIAPVYYRRKREDVLTELPELIEKNEWCQLTSENERSEYIRSLFGKNYMEIRRLSWQVDDLDDSCKAQKLMEIINEAESEGRKILVFSFFLDTIKKIHDYLGTRCLNPINGRISPQRRQEIIDEFDKAPAGTVLCSQIQSGGTGLNIQSASVVIICEPQFKPSIENQAVSRAYRMGQARSVLVYRLLCEDTVDEHINEILEQKQLVFDVFADKSVAAEKVAESEIDEKTFGRIIEEEIERIKKEEGVLTTVTEKEKTLDVTQNA